MNPRKTLEQWAFFLSYMGARLPALTEAQKTKYRAAVRTVCGRRSKLASAFLF
jgi:hypothetical protein